MPAATSTSRANGRSNGAGTSKLLVVLKLSSNLLKKFAPIPETKEKKKRNSSAATSAKRESASDSPPTKEEAPSSPASNGLEPPPPASSVDNASDAASTPVPGTSADANLKSLPGPKPGTKRSNPTGTPDNGPKPRGKPGPKKRPRLEDGTTENVRLSTTHRLGPKANTGAINAGLRALDRSGTPCRKWERKPFQLKSFTGVQWVLPSWSAPRAQKQETNGEAKEGALTTGDSDSRANQSASAVPSEKSNSGDGDVTPAHASMVEASSPALAMA